MLVWNIDPELISIGPIHIRYYGILFALGIAIVYYMTKRRVRAWGNDAGMIDDFLLWAVVAVVAGARLGHVLFYDFNNFVRDPVMVFLIWHGGLASHGAAVGLILAIWLFMHGRKRSFYDLADPIAIFTGIATSCVRIGNLINSEIVGRVTEVPWAFKFVRYDNEWRHPSQIYEALMGLGVFLVLYLLARKKGRWVSGGYFWSFICLYFICRFVVEFFKAYETIPETFPLTMGQLLSIPLVIISAYWLISRRSLLFRNSA